MALAGPPRSHENKLPPRLFSHQCLEYEFCELRLLGILGSPFAGCCIRSRNTPARWPWVAPIHTQGGRCYLRLDFRFTEFSEVARVIVPIHTISKEGRTMGEQIEARRHENCARSSQ